MSEGWGIDTVTKDRPLIYYPLHYYRNGKPLCGTKIDYYVIVSKNRYVGSEYCEECQSLLSNKEEMKT